MPYLWKLSPNPLVELAGELQLVADMRIVINFRTRHEVIEAA